MLDIIKKKIYGGWQVTARKPKKEYSMRLTGDTIVGIENISYDEFQRLKKRICKQEKKGDDLIVFESTSGKTIWFNRDKLSVINFQRRYSYFDKSYLDETKAEHLVSELKRKGWSRINKSKM